MWLRRLGYLLLAGAIALSLYAVQAASGPRMQAQAPIDDAAASAAIASSTPASLASSSPDLSPVLRVIDGDTFVALYHGATTTIRLIGLDTPETVDPRKPEECWGRQASDEAKKILTGSEVRLVPDPTQDSHDKYGRMLAYAYLPDGTLYEAFMIAEGYGHEYTYDKPYELQQSFKAAQARAQAGKLGLWSPATCNGNTSVGSSPVLETASQ